MAKLTRQELRIIEQTKREGEDAARNKKSSAWIYLRSILLFALFFAIIVIVGYMVIGALA